jgi:hypothetical protein
VRCRRQRAALQKSSRAIRLVVTVPPRLGMRPHTALLRSARAAPAYVLQAQYALKVPFLNRGASEKRRAMAKSGANAYWLAGDEPCPHCHFLYALTVERRCSVCDSPACPHCVTIVRETGEVVCRECQAETASESET